MESELRKTLELCFKKFATIAQGGKADGAVQSQLGQVLATVIDAAPASPGTWEKIGTTTVTAEDTTETTVHHWKRTA
jgi:hypothetical protein